jgi:hypothetical protein
LLLSVAAIIAIFCFKVDLLQTLAASAAAGAALYAIGLIAVVGAERDVNWKGVSPSKPSNSENQHGQ